MSGLSLYTIETGLLELMQAREELGAELANAECPGGWPERPEEDIRAEYQEVEKALAEYVSREIRKADGIHGWLKAADMTAKAARAEAAAFTQRAQTIEAGIARLKELCLYVMQAAGLKRIEGTAGRMLTRQGNGGLQPLTVQADVLPDNWRDIMVRMPLSWWRHVQGVMSDDRPGEGCVKEISVEPSNERIRLGLTQGPVPGARLEERGEHIRVRP